MLTVSHQIILAGLTASALAVYCLHLVLQRDKRRTVELTAERPHIYLLPAPYDQAKEAS